MPRARRRRRARGRGGAPLYSPNEHPPLFVHPLSVTVFSWLCASPREGCGRHRSRRRRAAARPSRRRSPPRRPRALCLSVGTPATARAPPMHHPFAWCAAPSLCSAIGCKERPKTPGQWRRRQQHRRQWRQRRQQQHSTVLTVCVLGECNRRAQQCWGIFVASVAGAVTRDGRPCGPPPQAAAAAAPRSCRGAVAAVAAAARAQATVQRPGCRPSGVQWRPPS
jgi:hypothetical protein